LKRIVDELNKIWLSKINLKTKSIQKLLSFWIFEPRQNLQNMKNKNKNSENKIIKKTFFGPQIFPQSQTSTL
jgi:hypothetical protein